jgi:diguanylate cyclase (GGDEF)-like protein/PAS domain S-box-containing protein
VEGGSKIVTVVAGKTPGGDTRRTAAVRRATNTPAAPLDAQARLAALGRIAAEVSGRLDLDDLFDEVLDHAEALFHADRMGLWLVESDEHPFRLAAARNISDGLRDAVAKVSADADAAGARAIRRQSILVVGPEQTTPLLSDVYRADGIETACLVPIVFRDEPLGILALYHHVDREWPPEELALAGGFADQMAAAIQNARLLASGRALAARLEAIADLSLRLNRIRDVKAIGEAIVVEASMLIEHDTIRVYRVDENSGWCDPIAWQGEFVGVDEPTPEMLRVRIGEGLTGWVARSGRTLRTGDAARDARTKIVGPLDGPESLLIVPMRYEDAVHGMVVASKMGRDRFTLDDEATLTIFAGYAAQALVNAEHAEQVRRAHLELEVQLASQRRLLEVTERLVSARDPREVLELIADALKDLVWYDTLSLNRVDRARGVRRAVVARDRFAEVILDYEAPLGAGLTGWVIAHAEAVMANDAHLDPRTTQIPGTPFEPESMLVVPLLVAGEVVGTLNIGRIGAEEAHFTEHELELTKLFAGQASLALQNAEAHRAAEVRARHDALTGLRNHGAFQQELGAYLASEGHGAVSLLMLDLDGFKAFNDVHGHPAGDILLREIATALERAVRDGDTVFRYGGDEFAVMLPHTGRVGALEVADRIRRAVADVPEPAGGPTIGISVGVACHPEDGMAKDDLVSAADRALYLAKPERSGDGRDADPRDAYLAALNETALALMDRLDPRELLEAILARATGLLGTSNGYIYLLDTASDELVVELGTGVFAGFLGFRMPSGAGLAGLVRVTGRPQIIADYDVWSGRASALPTGVFGSVAAVPLTSGTTVVGVLGLASGGVARTFGDRELAVLGRLGQLASIALDNARLFEAAQREVDERARAEAALRSSEERFRRLSDASAEALAIHRDGRILEVNQSFRELFRCPDEHAVGRSLMDFFATGSHDLLVEHAAEHPEDAHEVEAVAASGERFPVVIGGRPIPYPDGPASVASIRDLRERHLLEERLAVQARTDRVTGLPNRELLTERLAAILERPARSGRRGSKAIALILLDLDRFKVINERFGHAGGDDLLAAVGGRLRDALRPGDTVARFGGDEFALLIDGVAGPAEALAVAQRLDSDLRAPFELGGREVFVTARMGIVVLRPGAATVLDAFRDTEIALHRAKSDPSRIHSLFEPSMSAETIERLELEADLRRAVERGEMRVFYQPIVDLASDAMVGVEALVRWQHPRIGLIPPGRFIPVAEETGLILPIGRWVLETACNQARAWNSLDPSAPPMSISVNLSAREFSAEDLVGQVARIVRTSGLPRGALELEITESILMERSEAGFGALQALRDLGVRLALDDFGTGYSSLAYLRQLPLDTIKIDRTFVAGLGEDPAAAPIVRAVVSLAHGLGIDVVAEGVETDEQLAQVRATGCDRGQGYRFARPMPPEELTGLLGGGPASRPLGRGRRSRRRRP